MNEKKYKKVYTYTEAVNYINGLPKFSEGRSLADTKRALELLGNPDKKLKIVHVAGTNGKGSTCSFLASILQAAGKKTTFFSSPHLTDMCERFRIGTEVVSEKDFCSAFMIVYSVLIEEAEYVPVFFEYLFLMAMLIFKEYEPDYCILETGLGGRLDATNCIEKPVLTIITKIGYDHMEYLGNTLVEIAREKAGILKKGVPVVFLEDKKETESVIIEKAKSLSVPCVMVSKEDVTLHFFRDKMIDFSYKCRYYGYIEFTVATKAVYQTENAALAVAAAEELLGDLLTVDILQEGIARMHWEGRMEEVLPGVFFDGAHNEDGIDAFLRSVHQDGCNGTRSLLFSVVRDKQYAKMAKMITDSGVFDKIYTAPIDSARGVEEKDLAEIFGEAQHVIHMPSPEVALEEMLNDRGVDDYLYVAGSLYLIGQLKSWLKRVV